MHIWAAFGLYFYLFRGRFTYALPLSNSWFSILVLSLFWTLRPLKGQSCLPDVSEYCRDIGGDSGCPLFVGGSSSQCTRKKDLGCLGASGQWKALELQAFISELTACHARWTQKNFYCVEFFISLF